MTPEEAIGLSPTLSRLGPEVTAGLLECAEVAEFESGQTIITEGTEEEGVYLIVEGAVDVSGLPGEPASLGPGELFGEMATLFNMPRAARVVARTPTVVMSFSGDRFRDLLEANESLLNVLLEVDILRSA